MPTLTVTRPIDSYSVTIEPGVLNHIGDRVAQVAPHSRALLAVDAAIASTHGKTAERSLREAGYDVATVQITASETQKTLQTVQRIYSVMLAQRMERSSPVIALGGGIVGDVAGFAAATYLRGVPLVQAPTTLLAMVDASIGGKTGVNVPLPEGGMGKNLIGAFWQPRLVLADPNVLSTLDPRHLRCGLAESIKHAMIGDAALLDAIEQDAPCWQELECGLLDIDAATSLIARSAAVKVRIVQEDEREAGVRAMLNLGHTFAHALESIPNIGLHHGEAVGIGLCAASLAGALGGFCDEAYVQRVEHIVTAVGLPTRLSHPVEVSRLMQAMMLDKKVIDGTWRLIIPTSPGECRIVSDLPREHVESAWRHVGAK